MPKSTRIIGLAIGLMAFLGTANADVIYLKGGNKVEGQIIERTEKRVKIDIKGVTLSYDSDEIEKIESAALADPTPPKAEMSTPTTIKEALRPVSVPEAVPATELPVAFSPELIEKYKETIMQNQVPTTTENNMLPSQIIQSITAPISAPQVDAKSPASEIPAPVSTPEMIAPQPILETVVPAPQAANPAPELSPMGVKEQLKAALKEELKPLPAKEATGFAIDPAVAKMNTYDLVVAFIEANGTKESLAQMFQQILAQATAQDRERYGNQLKVDEIIKELVPTYSQYFSDEDLKGLITFYRSPLGRKLLNVAPNLTQDSIKTSAEYFKRKAQFIETLYPADAKGKKAPAAQ